MTNFTRQNTIISVNGTPINKPSLKEITPAARSLRLAPLKNNQREQSPVCVYLRTKYRGRILKNTTFKFNFVAIITTSNPK